MANTIRTYFGDGSELGVRMVYATEETPLGTAGSVLNARDELDERFLVISGDVLTDMDLGAVVRFHEEKGAVATLALTRCTTRSSSASSSPARTVPSSGSSRSRPGARSSATPSTPGSTCSSPRFSTSSHRGRRRLLGRGLPGGAGGRQAPLRMRVRGLLGGRRHDRGLPAGPQRHPRPEGPGRGRRVPVAPRRVARQGRHGRPERPGRGSGADRRQLLGRPRGASSGSTRRSATTSGSADAAECAARPSATTAMSGPEPGSRGPPWPGPATCGGRPDATPGPSSARTARSARAPRSGRA